MSLHQYLIPEGKFPQNIPNSLFLKFNKISTDPQVHSGWPHIKGTRILASDVLRSFIQYEELGQLIKEYRKMGAHVSSGDLDQALRFMIAWMNLDLNETKSKATK